MATERIVFRGSKEELKRAIRAIPKAIAGTGPDPLRLRDGVASRIAFVFFSLVARDFDRKSKGGEGDDGEKWLPNSRAYLAYQKGRFKQGHQDTSYRKGREQHLDAKNKRIWARANRETMRSLLNEELSGPGDEPTTKRGVLLSRRQRKAIAAHAAWAATRASGSGSLISFYPGQPDTILVDNGDLRRSIQPGIVSSERYNKADANQIFEVGATDVAVGTQDPKAAFHHKAQKQFHGDGQRGTVQRRLWPEVLPDRWVKEMVDELLTLFLRLPRIIAGRAGR